MTEAVKKRLFDALKACDATQEFVEDISFSEYEKSLLVRSAVERQLEIMGEALGKAAKESSGLEEEIPSIPRIVALRNRVIHGYDTVDQEILWDIVQTDVPTLEGQLVRLLGEE